MARKKPMFTCPECGADTPKEGLCDKCSNALADNEPATAKTTDHNNAMLIVGQTLVKVKPDAIWWASTNIPSDGVFDMTFRLVGLHVPSGKATIATVDGICGDIHVKYLEVVE